MNEKFSALSALVDGELDDLEERRVLDQASKDAELRRAWERYHLVRAAMTRQLDMVAPRGLADRIYDHLQIPTDLPATAGTRTYRWAGGLAVAASVAAVVAIGLPAWQKPQTPAAPTLASARFTPVEATVAKESTGANDVDLAGAGQPEGQLNIYLVGHNEFMPTAGMGGMLPYVRVVTHDRAK